MGNQEIFAEDISQNNDEENQPESDKSTMKVDLGCFAKRRGIKVLKNVARYEMNCRQKIAKLEA